LAKVNNIFKYWKQDLLAGLSVSFVALPLSMGIALLVGYPIESGVFAAIVGGMFGFVLGGTHVGIKGPGAGAIVALIVALSYFSSKFGEPNALGLLLACTFCAGLLLILTGLLKLGKYAQIIPSGAINGLLAGIGFIIVVKQIPDLLGYKSSAVSPIETFSEIPEKIIELNPISLMLGVISIVILLYHKNIRSKTIRIIPAAIWVLLVNVGLVLLLGLNKEGQHEFLGIVYLVEKNLLIKVQENVFNAIQHPSFIGLKDVGFWLQMLSIYFILLVENLLSAKAIDKIDPKSRKTSLDADLSASGLTTSLSSLIGGMPAITVIARSSVNVNVGAQTRFSNFAHGLLLAVLLLLAVPFINLIPKTALAAVLVVAGYRLCAPKVFNTAFKKGWEQLLIFTITFYATIRYGLVFGIIIGTVMDFLLSFFLSDSTFIQFWKASKNPYIKLKNAGGQYTLKLKGVISFFSLLKIEEKLAELPQESAAHINLKEAQVVDRTVLEFMNEESLLYEKKGGYLDIVGLENHHSSSPHPAALHILNTTWKKNTIHSSRQKGLIRFAAYEKFKFDPSKDFHIGHYQTFPYFKTRPLEYQFNKLTGNFENGMEFRVADIIFHEGELSAQLSSKTTVLSFKLDKAISQFSVENYSLYDKLKEFAFKDVEVIHHFDTLDDTVQIIGENTEGLKELFSDEVIKFLSEKNSHYIECNGKEILLFRQFRLANIEELEELIKLGYGLSQLLQ
jgi:MFS superfamily sulfate permease-like transporter